ncbi:MAG: hypothetical protein C0436_02400 [Alphaproteobacteria bacterium]|nr:hypothetical protein [Alphaproteobacteria bacterium]
MKTILLATTGLVAAAFVAGAASAETPKVTLGGYADFQAGYVSEDLDTTRRGTGFRNDNEITVHVDGKTDAGLGYGAVIDLEADITNDSDNQGTNAARTFTYLESGWGRAELGGNKGAAANLRVDASTLAVATGGINGAWTNFANGGVGNPGGQSYITTARGFVEHGSMTSAGDETFYNATKVTYYTPRYYGFQAGASYTPDISNRGQFMDRNDQAAGDIGEVWDLALNYENQFSNGLKLAAAGAYEMGEANTSANEDLRAWSLGALLGYEGFSVAASYGDWSDSNRAVNVGNDDSNYWTLGAGYEAGAYGVSATYFDSKSEQGAVADNDFSNLVVGADYKLAPGLTPYAEVSFFEFDSAGTANDNDGTAFILGTQLAF